MQKFIAKWPGDRYVTWRSLSWKEYNYFSALLETCTAVEVYCQVYDLVMIEGPKLNDYPGLAVTAGIVDYIGRTLLTHNPFNGMYEDIKRAVDIKREELSNSYLLSSKAIIAGLFHYSFEEIEEWDAEMFFERLVAAEYISGKKIEPQNPVKEKKDLEGKKQRPKKPLTEAQQIVIDRKQGRL